MLIFILDIWNELNEFIKKVCTSVCILLFLEIHVLSKDRWCLFALVFGYTSIDT